LADEEYEIPLLATLDAHGGRAPTSEVLDELGQRLADRLMPADLEPLDSGDIRWRNRAQFVRLRLIERGDMVSGSPRGIWEISDQGRDRLVAE
jgi:restriction system protein